METGGILQKSAVASKDPTSTCTKSTNQANQELIEQAIQRLREKGVKVVIWDMDLTMTKTHSHGRLQRGEPLEEFLNDVSPDFVQLVPSLAREGFGLAIATHSDEKEYSGSITPETHILGNELAIAVLKRHFDASVVSSFFIVAFNPFVRYSPLRTVFGGGWSKRHHIQAIQEYFQISSPQEMLLLDDTWPIVWDCVRTCGVQGISVNPKTAFVMNDVIEKL